ncbi:hypothetical protein [Thioclava sp. SK-1]|uniref:hypothetical protein n=1 Tax=Thioclava sp. SK-1 TaxID=1889770 RepID=UPI00159F1B37|nr:hypothetical protein [Thioclava sp. SK-1]
MDVKLWRSLDRTAFTRDLGYSYFRPETWAVILAWSFCRGYLLACTIIRLLFAKSTYFRLFSVSERFLTAP